MMYVALKPIYLYASGLLQIADIFLIFAAGFYLVSRRGKIYINSYYRAIVLSFLFVCLYQIYINMIWSICISQWSMNKNSLYYVYNLIVFSLFLILADEYGSEKIIKMAGKGLFIASIIIAFALLIIDNSGIRNTGLFNNPNQLGLFALLSLSYPVLFPEAVNRVELIVIEIVSIFAIIKSGSKASFIGAVFLVLFYIVFIQTHKGIVGLLRSVILAGLLFAGLYILFISDNQHIIHNSSIIFFRNRIINLNNEADSNLATGRGYDRIFEMGIHFLWGMGEGASSRYTSLSGKETHSLYANLLVSYGLIGALGYVRAFSKCIISKNRTAINICGLAGFMLYGLTHNSTRNTIFWILLAAVVSRNCTNSDVSVSPQFYE